MDLDNLFMEEFTVGKAPPVSLEGFLFFSLGEPIPKIGLFGGLRSLVEKLHAFFGCAMTGGCHFECPRPDSDVVDCEKLLTKFLKVFFVEWHDVWYPVFSVCVPCLPPAHGFCSRFSCFCPLLTPRLEFPI